MSKIILEGFKTKVTLDDSDAILLTQLFWYDKINNELKVGSKRLNYYFDSVLNKNILTTKTQTELPSKNVLPVEFKAIEKV